MIDLHAHTTRSDGSLTPTELVKRAADKGLKAIAITDHDTSQGIEEALLAGEKYGIEVVPGVELSTKLDGRNVHIVGLYLDNDNQQYKDFIEMMKDSREGRNLMVIHKLSELGLDISLEDFPPIEEGVIITKGNIARVLIEKGYASNAAEAITKYLEKGCPAYVPRKHVSPERAVEVIHKAGGVAILAHFNQIFRKDREKSYEYGKKVAAMGIDGIEVRYSEFDEELRSMAESIADEYGLLKSGGSDFHGDIKPDIEVGTGRGDLYVPYEYLAKIKEKKGL